MFGPILHFRGLNADGHYKLAIQGMADVVPQITVEGLPVVVQALERIQKSTLWRAEFTVAATEDENKKTYTYQGQSYNFYLPKPNLSIHAAAIQGAYKANETWKRLEAVHQQKPIHLLFHTGNQIDADQAFQHIPFLSQWRALPLSQRYKQPLPTLRQDEIRNFYYESYIKALSDPDIAPILATIPSLFSWDDHNILTNWGDQKDNKLQKSPVYTGLFRVARDAFWHGLQAMQGAPSEPLSWVHKIGPIGVIGLDLRSQRTEAGLLGEVGWLWLDDALTNLNDCTELLIISPTPIALPATGIMGDILGSFSKTISAIKNGQWSSKKRKGEWQILLDRLATYANQSGTKITIISGGLHTNFHNIVENGTARLNQLICADMSESQNAKNQQVFLIRKPQNIGQNRIRRGSLHMPTKEAGWLELEITHKEAPVVTWHSQSADAVTFTLE